MVTTASPVQFAFTFWTVSRPDDPYYVTNWDKRTKIEVVATDRQAAIDLADAAMGDAGHGRYWVFQLASARDIRIPEEV